MLFVHNDFRLLLVILAAVATLSKADEDVPPALVLLPSFLDYDAANPLAGTRQLVGSGTRLCAANPDCIEPYDGELELCCPMAGTGVHLDCCDEQPEEGTCSTNQACDDLGYRGECCPNSFGVWLSCCDEEPEEEGTCTSNEQCHELGLEGESIVHIVRRAATKRCAIGSRHSNLFLILSSPIFTSKDRVARLNREKIRFYTAATTSSPLTTGLVPRTKPVPILGSGVSVVRRRPSKTVESTWTAATNDPALLSSSASAPGWKAIAVRRMMECTWIAASRSTFPTRLCAKGTTRAMISSSVSKSLVRCL